MGKFWRTGELCIRVGKEGGNVWDAVNGEEIFCKQVSHNLDGYLEEDEMLKHIASLATMEGKKQ